MKIKLRLWRSSFDSELPRPLEIIATLTSVSRSSKLHRETIIFLRIFYRSAKRRVVSNTSIPTITFFLRWRK